MPNLKITPEKPPTPESSSQSSKPDDLVAMSHIPVLMGLFQSFKEKSNFSDGGYCNLYPELKKALGQRNIDNFDPLIDLLSAKFDLIFSDEDLPDRIKEQIARLQIYLFISAMQEKELLKRSSNPARRLLDTVIRIEVDFAVDNREEQSGYEFLRDQIDQIGNIPFIEQDTYAAILESYKAYIDGKTSVDFELVEETPIDKEDQLIPVEAVELKDVPVEDDVGKTKPVEEEVAAPVLETPNQPKAKKDKVVPLPDVKPVSMAEAMVRSISRPIDIRKPEIVKAEKITEPDTTEVIEEVQEVEEKAEIEEVAEIEKAEEVEKKAEIEEVAEIEKAEEGTIVEASAEIETPAPAEETDALEKPERPTKDSRDNIYPVIQSIINDMTLPLSVQGRSLIFFDEVWSPLLLEVARTEGFKSPAWQNILTIAKTHAWVLTPKSTRQELEKLISSVGHIEKSLSQSMQSLKLPVDQVLSLLEFLEHEQADVIALSNTNIEQLKEATKPEKQIPKESKVNQGQKPEKVNLSDTIDEFSTMMETGRFKKSNDMLKALNSDKTKQKKTKTASADTIHKSDWVEIKKGNSTVLAKLTWRAEDRSQFIFVDRNGNRVCEIDKDSLNKEFKAGTISLISSTPLSSKRAAYSVIQTIK